MESRRVLSEKEEILYQTKKHWAVFIKAAVYLGLAVLVLAAKGPILMHVPYTAQYEDARGERAQAPTKQKSQAPQDKSDASPLKDPQTQDDIKRVLVPVVSWTVTGACFALVVVLGLIGLALLMGFFSNKVIITTKRVIQHDVLSGSLSSLTLSRVESVRAATGLLGSVLGYGKVIMVMGSGQKVSIANLRRPHEFERELFGAK
jgi:hypothetical protein